MNSTKIIIASTAHLYHWFRIGMEQYVHTSAILYARAF